MRGLPFTKMQAVGNDFVVIEETVWGADTDWAQEAIRLCDRHKGVGADGLLVVCPSKIADVRMRMFNPDGTEDMCGNGLRCVVRWAVEHGHLKTSDDEPHSRTGDIETLVGPRFAHAKMEGGKVGEIVTHMGEPLFRPNELPMTIADRDAVLDYALSVEGYGTITVSTVNTGSTHTVIWVDELPDDELFLSLSPKIEHHPLYPERTSVLWARYSVARSDFEIRIWERGVGETLGCGTGACAVAVLAVRQGKKPRSVYSDSNSHHIKIRSKGGELTAIYIANAKSEPYGALALRGTAHTVYSGLTGR
ncbi:MAG: diaminopimelate epimerase [Fibrella sp.]|nr:diaminopimelate epimerase [Armatimonadota bacterium]